MFKILQGIFTFSACVTVGKVHRHTVLCTAVIDDISVNTIFTAVEKIISRAAAESVVSGSAEQCIVAVTSVENIVTASSFKNIVAGITGHFVIDIGSDHIFDIADAVIPFTGNISCRQICFDTVVFKV